MRMWRTLKDELLTNIKSEIREKQNILNEFMSLDSIDKEKAMKLSVELDNLISKFYKVKHSE